MGVYGVNSMAQRLAQPAGLGLPFWGHWTQLLLCCTAFSISNIISWYSKMYGTFRRVVLQVYTQVGYSPFYIIYS